MHRTNPLTAAFVGYTGGGARALVDTINDETGMQEMKGSFLKAESRAKIESPQNYGFTSVVRPAKKDKDGQIEECAEAYINFMGSNRSFPVAAVMDDRRYRPWGLKPGENSQYDDIGQMTLMRRNGLYLVSLDSEDDSQNQSGSGGGATPSALADSGSSSGQGKVVERMVSLRHVEKKKQPRPKGQQQSSATTGGSGGATPTALADTGASQGSSSQQSGKDHKHEGESVNTEVRCKKNKIEILDGETVVATYDKQAKSWTFSNFKKLTIDASDELNFKSKKISMEASERFETVGNTYLGLDAKGDGGPKVVTEGGPAKQTYAKV